MIAALNALKRGHPLSELLSDWALSADRRELRDLVAFGLVALPLPFVGVATWYVLASVPIALSLLGGWALVHRRAVAEPSRSRLLADAALSAAAFLAFVGSGLGIFFWALGPAPHF
jgi:hypothetical protein